MARLSGACDQWRLFFCSDLRTWQVATHGHRPRSTLAIPNPNLIDDNKGRSGDRRKRQRNPAPEEERWVRRLRRDQVGTSDRLQGQDRTGNEGALLLEDAIVDRR